MVFLGTLARHLDPENPKVTGQAWSLAMLEAMLGPKSPEPEMSAHP